MKKSLLKIAILGASGHIGRNFVFYFSKKKNNELFLFTRDEKKLKNTIKEFSFDTPFFVKNYSEFEKFKYDLIINCIGISDPETINSNKIPILQITEYYDNKILEYLKKNTSTFYIFISSGAAYGKEFLNPVNDSTFTYFDINNLNSGDFYSIAKVNAEAKHRSLNYLNIVDLRIFTFFSRFFNPNDTFLMSQIISAIKNKKTLYTNPTDVVRDFVHPNDLFFLVEKCIQQNSINDVFDVYSKDPISKFKILDSISEKYGLKYIVKEDLKFSTATGIKKNYFSTSRKVEKIGYYPNYTSLETIMDEIQHLL